MNVSLSRPCHPEQVKAQDVTFIRTLGLLELMHNSPSSSHRKAVTRAHGVHADTRTGRASQVYKSGTPQGLEDDSSGSHISPLPKSQSHQHVEPGGCRPVLPSDTTLNLGRPSGREVQPYCPSSCRHCRGNLRGSDEIACIKAPPLAEDSSKRLTDLRRGPDHNVNDVREPR